jgi:ABC-type transporter Mla subunit MlaD
MTTTLTLQDLFNFILYLLGVGVLIYLIVLIKNINSVASDIRHLLTSNRKEIDTLIKELSETVQNANTISNQSKEIITSVSSDAKKLVRNISSISEKLDSTSEKVYHVVGQVNESFTATKDAIKNINYYIDIIVELVDIIKNTIKKHRR